MRYVLALSLVALLPTACGDKTDNTNNGDSDGDTDTDSPQLTLTVDPESLNVVQGTSAIAVFTIGRTNLGDGVVSLTVDGAPSGATATFDVANTTATSATLTISASFAATPGAATVTVTAAADGAASVTASLALTVAAPAPINVAGTIANANGTPYAGDTVHVFGHGAAVSTDTTTDAVGAFSVTNIQPPYDVVFVEPDGDIKVYIGVVSATPALGSIFDGPSGGADVEVSGTITQANGAAVTEVVVDVGYGGSSSYPSTTTYDFYLPDPPSGTSVNALIRALQYDVDTDGIPTDYLGFAEVQTVLDTSSNNVNDLTPVGPIASQTVTVRARDALGNNVDEIDMNWQATDHIDGTLVVVTPISDTFTTAVPTDARAVCYLDIGVHSTPSAGSTHINKTLPSLSERDRCAIGPAAHPSHTCGWRHERRCHGHVQQRNDRQWHL